jgi:UTP--glucose-1-phosphate uridylyltransferase
MKKQVRKAVIPAAGFGTRFLPQTKAMPKEMLPLVDKPIIQYIVEQLVEAGIEDIIIVTGYNKRSIEDHFDAPNEDLLNNLRAGGPSKAHLVEEMKEIADLANFVYVRQKGPYGLATPLMNVAPLIDDEPFIYALPDDLAVAKPNYFQQMIALYQELGGNILPCMRVGQDEVKKYGMIGGEAVRDGVIKMNRIIEKPQPDDAPSDYASVMGYLFSPDIFPYIERGRLALPKDKEFQLTDHVIQPMLADGKAFYGCEIKNSVRYDTGNSLGYLQTVMDFALAREDVGPQLREYLRKKLE